MRRSKCYHFLHLMFVNKVKTIKSSVAVLNIRDITLCVYFLTKMTFSPGKQNNRDTWLQLTDSSSHIQGRFVYLRSTQNSVPSTAENDQINRVLHNGQICTGYSDCHFLSA